MSFFKKDHTGGPRLATAIGTGTSVAERSDCLAKPKRCLSSYCGFPSLSKPTKVVYGRYGVKLYFGFKRYRNRERALNEAGAKRGPPAVVSSLRSLARKAYPPQIQTKLFHVLAHPR